MSSPFIATDKFKVLLETFSEKKCSLDSATQNYPMMLEGDIAGAERDMEDEMIAAVNWDFADRFKEYFRLSSRDAKNLLQCQQFIDSSIAVFCDQGNWAKHLGWENKIGQDPKLEKKKVSEFYSLLYHLISPTQIPEPGEIPDRKVIEDMFELLDLGKPLSEEEVFKRGKEIIRYARQQSVSYEK